MNVCGFSPSCKCITVCDGKKDWFTSCPAQVKRAFSNTQAIRQFMGITENCKVYAIVLEDYQSKGPHMYELLLNGKVRSGFGKGTVKFVKPSSNTNAATVATFFGSSSSSSKATVEPGVSESTVSMHLLVYLFTLIFISLNSSH